jgi:hypothetical protein
MAAIATRQKIAKKTSTCISLIVEKKIHYSNVSSHTVQVYRMDWMNVEYIVYNEKHGMPIHKESLVVKDNRQQDVE